MTRRLTVLITLILLTLQLPALAQEPRVVPPNDPFNSRIRLERDASGTVPTIEDSAAHEIGEPLASCAIDIFDTDSVWFKIHVPAGKLKFTAVGTDFIPVVTLYRSEGPITNLGPELGCATNPTTGATITTVLTTTVEQGPYIIRVAVDTYVNGAADYALDYTVKFTPPAGISIPSNDTVENARPIIINKIAKTNNAEYATNTLTDPPQTCTGGPMFQTVWYTFTLEGNTEVIISTEGSMHGPLGSYVPADLMVFSGPPSGPLTPHLCASTGGIEGAGWLNATLNAGTYTVAVYSPEVNGLIKPSTSRLLVLAQGLNTLENSSFDSGLTSWKLKNGTGDAIVTGAGSFDGSSFVFVGGPEENSQLSQAITVSGFIVPPDSFLRFSYTVEHVALMTQNPTYEITLTYADGTVQKLKGKIEIPPGVGAGAPIGDSYVITKKGMAAIKLKIKNKATSGELMLDLIRISISPAGYGLRDSVLPLPPPAQ